MTEAMPFPKTDIVLSYESAPKAPRFLYAMVNYSIKCNSREE